MQQDQVPDEKEPNVSRTSPGPASSDVCEDVAAVLPMSLLRELLREELDRFAETRLKSLHTTGPDKQLLTTELGKHGPARDPPSLRSSCVDTGPGESLSVRFSAELGELMPNCVSEPSDLRRPPREVRSDIGGHRVAAAWQGRTSPNMSWRRSGTYVQISAKSKESWLERLVDDSIKTIARFSDDVDRQCTCPLVEQLVGSSFFSFLTGLLILANSVVMALAAEYEIQHIEDSRNQTYVMVELGFVIAYTVEWLLRAWSGRCRFLGSGWCWFDLCILLGGWLEVGGGNSYVTQFRIMRTLKMLKVMRIVRLMRSFREVRVLLDSLMGSVRPLFWATLIIAGITFMFAILFVNSVASYLSDQYDSGYSDIDTTERTSLLDSWGSVTKSMYTLFSCVTGGEDWRVAASLLAKVGSDSMAYFLSYIVFFVFAITNSVCAFFVEAASVYASSDLLQVQQDRLSKKRKYVDAMTAIFRESSNDCGCVTKADFMMVLEDRRMARFLAELDIDSQDLSNFFDRLSAQGKKAVDVDLFVEGCIRMCGQARSMDMLELLTQSETLYAEMRKIRTDMEDAGILRVSPNTARLPR